MRLNADVCANPDQPFSILTACGTKLLIILVVLPLILRKRLSDGSSVQQSLSSVSFEESTAGIGKALKTFTLAFSRRGRRVFDMRVNETIYRLTRTCSMDRAGSTASFQSQPQFLHGVHISKILIFPLVNPSQLIHFSERVDLTDLVQKNSKAGESPFFEEMKNCKLFLTYNELY